MNLRIIGIYLGHILRIEGLFMFPALFISLYKNEHNCVVAFGITIALLLIIGQLLLLIKPKRKEIFAREGFDLCIRSTAVLYQRRDTEIYRLFFRNGFRFYNYRFKYSI